MTRKNGRGAAVAAAVLVFLGASASEAEAQVERVYHPTYLPASHNWEFRGRFPAVNRLFNAFDYGHGVLYETLWSRPGAPPELLEEEIYDHLIRRVLANPPRLPMPEASFMPRYARLAPLAKEMFEWAHILHRQSYDILADTRLDPRERDAAMQELLDHYLSSPLAFTAVPKGMEIMDDQRFSRTFRERYPKFNGLIWAYHWLQVAAYEPLLVYEDPDKRQTGMNALLARFWQMLEEPPSRLPGEMPMVAAIAPNFADRYPLFAAIFDNLHMMHDVISDILVSEEVSRGEKRAEIYRQADHFRDPEFMAVSVEEWRAMARAHGLDAQGGPAVDWLPEATTRGAEAGPEAGRPEPADPVHRHHAPADGPAAEVGETAAATVTEEVREIVASFHAALARGDSAAALGLLHPEVRIYEQGHAETLEEYRAGHLAADVAFAAAVRREVVREEVIAGEDMALYVAETAARGTFRGREVDAAGTETVHVVRTPDGWRIRHIHWSSR